MMIKKTTYFILILITVLTITFYIKEIDFPYLGNRHKIEFDSNLTRATLNQDFPLQDEAIFKKLNSSQNPANGCQNKLLIYDTNVWPCGFGCTLHQIAIHLSLAYHTNRTLIVRNTNALHYFKPIGINCSIDLKKYKRLSQNYTEDQIIYIYDQNQYIQARSYSLNLLNDLKRNYSGSHKEPLAWLSGHFINYIMQYSDQFKAMADRFAKQIGFKKNCVGIHVRRTDKKQEAKLFELSEYMGHVDLYYKKDPFRIAKCVYLITDEKAVLDEAKQKFKEYHFIFSNDHAKFTHYTDSSIERLENILLDVYFLSQCEYLVCTLSSNIGRVVYEKWALKYNDLADRVANLDVGYFLSG